MNARLETAAAALSADQQIGQIAVQLPGATAVFRRLKLDFCCGGQVPLATAAAEKGLDVNAVLSELAALQRPSALPGVSEPGALVDHILARYHDVHRVQLPELIRMAHRVEAVHRANPDVPAGLGNLLEEIQQALLFFSQTSGVGGASTGPAAGQANCSNFKPTSPLGGLPFGQTTFYWDGAPGATSYIVNLYDETGALKASFETAAPNTNLVGDTSGLGGGFSFSWEVVALVNGQVACTSANVTMFREAPPPVDLPQSTPEPSYVCGNYICEAGEDYYNCYIDCGGW